jgi:tetratricopeptide (TPR) repeat protein
MQVYRVCSAVVPSLVVVFTIPSAAFAQPEDPWLGKRVVQAFRDFTLRINDEPVERMGRTIDVYQVERVEERSLWLKSEKQRVQGSASIDSIVPVERAIEYFTQQIRGGPQDAFPYAMRAFVRHVRNENDLALQDYDQAIRLGPQDPAYYCGRGSVWQAKKQADKAAADFSAALRLDPKNVVALIGRGMSRASKQEYSKAIDDFSEAIWLDPLAIAAYINRGQAWHSKKEHEKAVIDYNMAIRLDAEHADAHCHRGRAFAAQKKFAKALADYDEAIRLDPRHGESYMARAWLLATCPDAEFRNGERAVSSATKACELLGWNDRSALEALAAACAAAGDFDSAVKWQTKADSLGAGVETKATGWARIELYRARKPYVDGGP